jgi:hypothetical protein
MANNQANNAPFLSQNNYDDVAGVSNSPFTDQRAVAAGGGGSGSAGNMVFTPDGVTPGTGKISYDDNGTNESILAIDQTTDDISLKTDQSLSLIADSADIIASADVTVTGGSIELNSAGANAAVQVDDGSSSVNVIADDTFRAEVGQNAFPLQNPYDSLLDMTGSNIDMQVVDPLFPPGTLNKTARLQMIEPNALLESEIKMEASEIDLISYASVTNGISLQTRDIAGGIISEFALNSSSANNVPPAVVGRNVQYYQFATRDPNFAPPGGVPVPNPLRPTYRFSQDTGAWRFIASPNAASAGPGSALIWNGSGAGSQANPYELTWQPGADLSTLVVNFDKDNSTLKLEDTAGGTTTTLSTTAVVPGRTVQIARHTINTYGTDISIFDLAAGSGSTPPGPSSKLVGNNPPRVLLDPQGNTQWQVGNSFRLTASGRLNNFTLGDRVQVKIWSNRGQTLQTLIGSFNVNTTDSSTTQIGWKMYLEFTCRTLSGGGFPPVPGTFSANAQFLYSDDATVREVLGAVWVNNSTSFNTDIDQYFDVTFQLNGSTNSLAVDLAVIERLY